MPRKTATIVTYGRRHQMRQVRADDDGWGSVFGKDEKDPVFGSSFSSGQDSSTKLSDSSSDFSTATGNKKKANDNKTKPGKQDKENVQSASTRRTRKKASDLYKLSDGLSNTSSEMDTSTRDKRPLRERNINSKTAAKPPKAKRASNKRKTRKKEKEEVVINEQSGLFDISQVTEPKVVHYSQHFSEFEDFSLCIEKEAVDDAHKEIVVNAPPNLTQSSSSDNNSQTSSHRSLQHSTPNVHTSTPQMGREHKEDLFRRLTKSNLKKLAASGGMSPFHLQSRDGSIMDTASPAFSHISHRRESMESDFDGESLMSITQESAANPSLQSSLMVTTRRRKPLNQSGTSHVFNISSILSTPAMLRGFAPIVEDDGGEQQDFQSEDEDILNCEEKLNELTISYTYEPCTTKEKVKDISQSVRNSILKDIVENDDDHSCSVVDCDIGKDEDNYCSIHSSSDKDCEMRSFHTDLDADANCSHHGVKQNNRMQDKDLSHHSTQDHDLSTVSSSEQLDNTKDSHPNDVSQHSDLQGVTSDNSHMDVDNLSDAESEADDVEQGSSHPPVPIVLQTPRCNVVLSRLPNSVISQYTNAGSSDYDASKSLFDDLEELSYHTLNEDKSEYDTAEDKSPVVNLCRNNLCYASSTEATSERELEIDEFCSAVENIRPRPLLSRIDELEESYHSLMLLTPVKSRASGRILPPRTKVLLRCDQEEPITFNQCIPSSMMKKCVKIGEGVYGEVFRSENKRSSVALKIIPIEGNFTVNDEPQKSFAEILPEIVISQTLSELSDEGSHSTPNFVQVHSSAVVQGSYPDALIKQWDKFHAAKVSENDRPDMFPDTQMFIVFEFADSGCDLEGFKFKSLREAKSVLVQVALSLAVAESALEFEHRDLHWGNVLVKRTTEKTLDYTLDEEEMALQSHGVQVAIIDFTLSRLRKDGCTVSTDLSLDPTLFEGEGDYQFDVYRLTKEENGNNWEPFHPYTNVLWVHYLADKLLRGKVYPRPNTKEHQALCRQFRTLLREALEFQSAVQLINECSFFSDEIFS